MSLIKRIDDAIQKRIDSKTSRSYLGASGLGQECDRKLWYSYKQPKNDQTPRTQRIFDMGHMLEEYLVRLIRDAGITIHTHDENNDQFGFEDGIIAGHIDGVLEDGTPVLIEFKSYNKTRFAALKKSGVKESDPTYFTQIQVYMNKMELDRCLFMAICKDDAELYEEYVDYDPIEANWALNRGQEIGHMETEPDKKYNHISHFKCKLCNWRKECWSE